MTGSTQGALSGAILMTLMQMQQQSSNAASSGSSATSTTSASTLASSDPLQQLFSAMDSNSDGSVSQGEMESYIEGVGGTQADADSLYSALSQNSSSTGNAAASTSGTAGITESQMSSALSQAQQAQGGGYFHHHHNGQAGGAADTLLQALDTNSDGSGSLTSANFAQAWSNLQAQQTSQSSGTMVGSLLDAFTKAGSTGMAASTTSVSA
jgi:hypothetical protein